MTSFASLVATSAAVAATSARSEKVALLAETIRTFSGADEIRCGVSFLTGEPRQGKVGVGWASLSSSSRGPHAADEAAALSVCDIDEALTTLAGLGGAGSVEQRRAFLAALFERATAAEADFLVRLLTGELRQGANAGVVTDAVAKAAGVPLATVRRAAMLAGDLPLVAAVALAEGAAGLAGIGLRPLQPVQPMLASTSASVAEAMEAVGGEASVEWKLDGARVQAHLDGDEVRLFTRNLNDVTSRLGGVVEVVRSLSCSSSVVLDGEVIGLADEDERPDAFQDTMSRFGRHAADATSGLVVRFFDVLHVDGRDLIDEPLSVRLAILEEIAGPWRVPGLVTSDVDEAVAFSDGALALGHEGVMVKALSSTYEAGRRGGSWRKVKPVRTLDLVVLGAEWGHGRRKGWLSNLHLGARDPATGGFVMVGKTFKGLTDALLTWQTARLQELAVEERGIIVFVRPELVVEIALDGAQSSTRYPGGVALRFARVKGYREDKSPAEADTIDDVRALLQGSS